MVEPRFRKEPNFPGKPTADDRLMVWLVGNADPEVFIGPCAYQVEDGLFIIRLNTTGKRHDHIMHMFPVDKIARAGVYPESDRYWAALDDWYMTYYHMSYKEYLLLDSQMMDVTTEESLREKLAKRLGVDPSKIQFENLDFDDNE